MDEENIIDILIQRIADYIITKTFRIKKDKYFWENKI